MLRNTLFALFLSFLALSAGAAKLEEGFDYQNIVPPQPTDARGKVEVTEFFSYGCSHCARFEPVLSPWVKRLPKDVSLRRVPVAFSDSWLPFSNLYYTLEALGEVDRLHVAVFEAIHDHKINLADPKILEDWLTKKGVDLAKVRETARSFTVQTKVKRAQQIHNAHAVKGVPSMVVDGRFRPADPFAGSYDDLLKVVDALIVKARQK
ncbi:MAG: thiol:disulfide interchange protein DsbA/DsbL [Sulfurisoma sp.]|nr:thiol:disulfide interchange protein DsbA/DsbL [Sulfurisoma sp.]